MIEKQTIIGALDYVIASYEDKYNPPTPACEFDRRLLNVFKAHLDDEKAEILATELLSLIDTL